MVWKTSGDKEYICGPRMWDLIVYGICSMTKNRIYFTVFERTMGETVACLFANVFVGPISFENNSTLNIYLYDVLREIEAHLYSHDENCKLFNIVVDAINEYYYGINKLSELEKEWFSKKPKELRTHSPKFHNEKFCQLENKLEITENDIYELFATLSSILLVDFDISTSESEFIKPRNEKFTYYKYADTPIMRLEYIKKRIAARRIIRFLIRKVDNASGLRQFLWKPEGPLSKLSYAKTLNNQKKTTKSQHNNFNV